MPAIDAAPARTDLLIADLVAYRRLSRADIAVQPVALDAAMASALAQVEVELRQRQAQVHVASELPRVMAHHATLVQVVANLLTNAAKFMAPDTRPEVAVWAEAGGAWTRLWVADNGIGIAPEHRHRRSPSRQRPRRTKTGARPHRHPRLHPMPKREARTDARTCIIHANEEQRCSENAAVALYSVAECRRCTQAARWLSGSLVLGQHHLAPH